MRELERAEYALLQDTRAPRGRDDPAFEATVVRERHKISGGFRKVALP